MPISGASLEELILCSLFPHSLGQSLLRQGWDESVPTADGSQPSLNSSFHPKLDLIELGVSPLHFTGLGLISSLPILGLLPAQPHPAVGSGDGSRELGISDSPFPFRFQAGFGMLSPEKKSFGVTKLWPS